ncbi:MAG TPA: xylulokinase [Candidatus Cryosericum sp.]|nr:xylulokinase [Candidatus Cryosericum sp.]
MKQCTIGIDIGTAAVKGLLVDTAGTVVSMASTPLRISTPRPGWMEEDPEDWWKATVEVCEQLTIDRNVEILTISVSGQMHTLVPLDAAGTVVRPAILWSDLRAAGECQELTDVLGGEEQTLARVGNPVMPEFTAPKFLWLEHHEPELVQRIARVCMPKDYVVLRLTGRFVSEPSDASGTLFYRVPGGGWDQQVLDAAGVETSMLPEIVDTGSIVGAVICSELPRLRGIPVVAGGADNAVASLGCGVQQAGDAVIKLGTRGTIVAATEVPQPDPAGRLCLFNLSAKSRYYHMAVVPTACGALSWFQERFARELSHGHIDELVAQSPVGSNGVVFLPSLAGDRTPHRNPDATGVLYGMRLSNSQGDVLRAVHEGVAFALRQAAEAVVETGTELANVRIIGGGSRSRVWCQMLADCLGLPLWSPLVDEGASYGSARLAAAAAGIDTSGWVKVVERYIPDPSATEAFEPCYEKYKALYDSLKPMFNSRPQVVLSALSR